MIDKIKTYHVRCGNIKCKHNHSAICFAGIITLNEQGVCLCCINEEERENNNDT